jgi:tetratricopeptide (TPR) repeat protein
MDKEKLDYYAKVLDLEYNFSLDDVKKNYYRLMKEYHPDKFLNQGEDSYKKALNRFHEIKEAYEYILENYNKFYEKSQDKFNLKNKEEIEHYFISGINYFKKGDINSALNCFLICHRRLEDNPKYIRWIIRCLFTKDRRLLEALEYCQKLLKIEPYRNENYYLTGKCYYLLKNKDQALFFLKKAKEMGYSIEDIDQLLENLEPKSIVKRLLSKFQKS